MKGPLRKRHFLPMPTSATGLRCIGLSFRHVEDNRLANTQKLLLREVSFHVVYHPTGQNNIVLSIPFCGISPIQTDRIVARLQTHAKTAVKAFALLLNIEVFKPVSCNVEGPLFFFSTTSCTGKEIPHTTMHIFTISLCAKFLVTTVATRSIRYFGPVLSRYNPKIAQRQMTIAEWAKLCFGINMIEFVMSRFTAFRTFLCPLNAHYLIPFFSARSRMASSRIAVSLTPKCFANNFRSRLASSLRRMLVGFLSIVFSPCSSIVAHIALQNKTKNKDLLKVTGKCELGIAAFFQQVIIQPSALFKLVLQETYLLFCRIDSILKHFIKHVLSICLIGTIVKEQEYHPPQAPQKGGPFIPALNGRGFLGRFGKIRRSGARHIIVMRSFQQLIQNVSTGHLEE